MRGGGCNIPILMIRCENGTVQSNITVWRLNHYNSADLSCLHMFAWCFTSLGFIGVDKRGHIGLEAPPSAPLPNLPWNICFVAAAHSNIQQAQLVLWCTLGRGVVRVGGGHVRDTHKNHGQARGSRSCAACFLPQSRPQGVNHLVNWRADLCLAVRHADFVTEVRQSEPSAIQTLGCGFSAALDADRWGGS